MSDGKIDVLVTLDAAAQWRGDLMGDFTSAAELKAARAAVAELIEAATDVNALSIQSEAHMRLRLALRRVAANT